METKTGMVGAVITFEGMTVHEVKDVLIRVGEKLRPGQYINSIQAETYDPNMGSPVFYVP